MTIRVELGEGGYDIALGRCCFKDAANLFELDRKVMIAADDTLPEELCLELKSMCGEAYIWKMRAGEENKSLRTMEGLLKEMLDKGFTRGDCVCALGGGVIGDLAGFAASCYMRGIDFYNIPTTLLSQLDSSIGGKTAVNFWGYKNMIGSFWQPKGVIVDPDLLNTLPERQLVNGLAEAIKAGLIDDEKLFEIFESGEAFERLDEVIEASLQVKKSVVERDERESGLRRILNFGHTIAHGIESATSLLHGECVALGMIPMCSDKVRERLIPVLEGLGLPTYVKADREAVYSAILHDKKMEKGRINTAYVEEPGSCKLVQMDPKSLVPLIDMVVK